MSMVLAMLHGEPGQVTLPWVVFKCVLINSDYTQRKSLRMPHLTWPTSLPCGGLMGGFLLLQVRVQGNDKVQVNGKQFVREACKAIKALLLLVCS